MKEVFEQFEKSEHLDTNQLAQFFVGFKSNTESQIKLLLANQAKIVALLET